MHERDRQTNSQIDHRTITWIAVGEIAFSDVGLKFIPLLDFIPGVKRTKRQSARMSKITNDGLTRSGTGCFIAVPIMAMATVDVKG